MKKLFKSRNREVLDRLDDLEIKMDDIKLAIKNISSDREKRLEDMLIDMKSKKIAEYETVIKRKQDENSTQQEIIDRYAKECDKQNKTIEALKKENIELANHVKDLQSDHYLKVELPADKPKKQKLGIKSGVKNSKANKMLKEISENNLRVKE